ncbi:MAG TPA: Gfo/Idh/MocA family oxidoreductase [Propionibacteriaceae bacterium]|nr:Gfo/Idh/MocA family oxidoreductase [Propionibacteriaceae bacterium]
MTLTLPAPRIIDADAVPALRWGVVGVGIADRFVSALHAHTPQRAVAVTSRRRERAESFAATHGVVSVYDSVDALVSDPAVDAVYVATPHPLHLEQAMAAIAHGKHVLVEKPIAMSAAEAATMTAAGRDMGVLVMEAMWTRYLPQSDIVRQILADGLIGDVSMVLADFGFCAPADPTHRLWNPELGGGALLDAGVYPVSFASSVLGAPSEVHAVGTALDNGVDVQASLALGYASGATALVATSLRTVMPIEAQVLGSAGRLKVLSPFFGPSGVEVTTGQFETTQVATWRDERYPGMYDAMCGEAIAFASYVAEGRVESPLHPHDEVVSVLATIDEARAQLTGSR